MSTNRKLKVPAEEKLIKSKKKGEKKQSLIKLPLLCVLCQVFTRYGKCYMFNAAEEGKTLRTTMKGGTGNGLEIMLDIQQDEYLPVWGDTGRRTTSPLTCLLQESPACWTTLVPSDSPSSGRESLRFKHVQSDDMQPQSEFETVIKIK